MLYKNFIFDYISKENIKEHNLNDQKFLIIHTEY